MDRIKGWMFGKGNWREVDESLLRSELIEEEQVCGNGVCRLIDES